MKKRDKILIWNVLLIAFIIISLIFLAKKQLEQFNKAYIDEEKEEITSLAKQVSWAVKPILKKHNIKELNEYATLFLHSDTRLTVWDSDGNIICDSINANTDNIPKNYVAEETFMASQMIYHSMPLKIQNEIYTLTLSTTTNHINKILVKSKKYILISVIVGTFIVFILACYIFGIYKSFNRLQNSAIKISTGDLNTDIFIPKGGMLYELALALSKMSNRLKSQILEMRKLEDFRSEFIANVSHEVKTPLTGILSAVELLNEELPDKTPKTEKCLNILEKQSKRLNSLVQDILTLSELEKPQKINLTKINPVIAINNSIALCSIGDIKINLKLKDVYINGDSELLEQAITNILTNAIKYSQSEVIDIELTTISGFAQIIIRDYGIGIPQEHLPRLFEHFYRVDKARSRNLGGTGLGLSIVQNIVKLHNGKIIITSDNGCKFVIEIPLYKER